MICEECKKEDKKSKVYDRGSRVTLIGWQSYFDEDGKHHSHDPNKRTTEFSCSNGHKWEKVFYDHCWCGWDNNK